MGEILYWIRRIFLGFGVLALVAVGLGLGYEYLYGDGTMHVLAPSDIGVTVEIDGTPRQVAQGEHGQFSVKHGAHRVTVKMDGMDPVSYENVLIKNGFSEEVIPVDPAQCFVDLDVGDAFYGDASKPAAPPRVTYRYLDGKPFEKRSNTYLRIKELPTSIDEGSSVGLLVPMQCEDARLADAQILELLELNKKN